MYKDEMIQIHQFLVYILKYLEKDENIKKECKEYTELNISPHHIHRTKAEHKHAIFVLAATIAGIIANKEKDIIPLNVVNALNELSKRSKKEINNEKI